MRGGWEGIGLVDSALVPLGTRVPGYGVIEGVRYGEGERFYFVSDEDGGWALLPHTVVVEILAVRAAPGFERGARADGAPSSENP